MNLDQYIGGIINVMHMQCEFHLGFVALREERKKI